MSKWCAFLLLVLWGWGCRPSPSAEVRRERPDVAWETCRLDSVRFEARCGWVEVSEDPARPEGRRLKLKVAVLPALAPSPAPDPLFILAGGPGQAATEVGGALLPMLERVRRERDVVLVDQRGTGQSNPLDCVAGEEVPLAQALKEGLPEGRLKQCLAGYDADVRFYTTPFAMDDLDEVRARLGYEQVNLWGASYGTRAALVYMRRHPTRVRTAVLDGVAPVDMLLPLTFAEDAEAAIEKVFRRCQEDAACRAAFPRLRERFSALLLELERAPARVEVSHPRTARRESVEIQRDAFTPTLRGILYMPEITSLVPLVIDRAAQQDFGPFLALATGLAGGFEKSLSLGMFLAVICAEDAANVTEEAVLDRAKGTFLGPTLGREVVEACQAWPRGALPEGYGTPVTSSVPTLLLSGELDPVTPPRHAERAQRGLSRSKHLVVPGVAHGVSTQGCGPRWVAHVLEKGDVADVEQACQRPARPVPFFISFAGPTP